MFLTPKGSFEPTVMFFGLTNSPVIFQTMMNNLLRDLVVEEKIVVFINNVMIATKTEEGHNEIAKEVLRRLEKKNLFVKPEMSRSLTMDLTFIFTLHFLVYFMFIFFSFSIFRTTRVRVYQSRCHISHKLMA